jgi:hypothetical protein
MIDKFLVYIIGLLEDIQSMFKLFYGNFVVINNEKDQFTIFIRQNYTKFF